MTLHLATPEHHTHFAQWRDWDRLERLTCRPIVEGQRVVAHDEPLIFAFLVAESEIPAGKVTCSDFNARNHSAEFGYRVHPEQRGKGIGTQMLSTFFNLMFSATELNKLYCQTGAFNQPSIRLLEKLGLHRDGILREHHELDGQLWDDYIYSILRREWQDIEISQQHQDVLQR
jgi:ribosomal-protein-alanine N-acetyltransferase